MLRAAQLNEKGMEKCDEEIFKITQRIVLPLWR